MPGFDCHAIELAEKDKKLAGLITSTLRAGQILEPASLPVQFQ